MELVKVEGVITTVNPCIGFGWGVSHASGERVVFAGWCKPMELLGRAAKENPDHVYVQLDPRQLVLIHDPAEAWARMEEADRKVWLRANREGWAGILDWDAAA